MAAVDIPPELRARPGLTETPPPSPPERFLPEGPPPRRWTGDGEGLRDDTRKDSRWGLLVAAVFFIGFLGWAAFARLDAAVYGNGQVAVLGNRQAVQHRDGGTVQQISVHEGQHVERDQVLLVLAATEAAANQRAASGSMIGARALQARLTAEMRGLPLTTPPEFASLTGQDRIDADEAMALQRSEYSARASALQAQRGVLSQERAQSAEQISGLQQQIAAAQTQQRLIQDELVGVQRLATQGLVPLTRLRALQREAASLQGNIGQYTAEIGRAREAMNQVSFRLSSLDRDRTAEVASQLRDVEARLTEVTPRVAAYSDQLLRTSVRAPTAGRVVGLSVFNAGAVVSPGQRLMDIVPDRDTLIIEARISPADADDVHPGQRTEIKITAFPGRELPVLYGEVQDISADALTDEASHQPFFRVFVSVPPSQLDIIRRYQGAGALRPGLPAEVVIPLRERTALDYLFEPFRHALWRSFREQ